MSELVVESILNGMPLSEAVDYVLEVEPRKPQPGDPDYQSGSHGPTGPWGSPQKDWLPPPDDEPDEFDLDWEDPKTLDQWWAQQYPEEEPTETDPAALIDKDYEDALAQLKVGYDPTQPDEEDPEGLEPPEHAVAAELVRNMLQGKEGPDREAEKAAELAYMDHERRRRAPDTLNRLRYGNYVGDFRDLARGKVKDVGQAAKAIGLNIKDLVAPNPAQHTRNVEYLKKLLTRGGKAAGIAVALLSFLRSSGVGKGIEEL